MNDRQLKDLLAKMDDMVDSFIMWILFLICFLLIASSVNSVLMRLAAHDCYTQGYSHYENDSCSKTVDGTDVIIRVADLPELEEEDVTTPIQ